MNVVSSTEVITLSWFGWSSVERGEEGKPCLGETCLCDEEERSWKYPDHKSMNH